MPQLILSENNCSAKLDDCIVYVSLESGIMKEPVPHAEGICIRCNEINFVELKDIKGLYTDTIEHILAKVNSIPAEAHFKEEYGNIGNFLSRLNGKKFFYLFVPGDVYSTFIKQMKNKVRGPSVHNIDYLCVRICGTDVRYDRNRGECFPVH